MAVLNKIRQRSLFLILIIALALFSFVLADLFRNGSALTSKSQNIVATINGKDITREDFMQKVEIAQQQTPSATSNQIMNRVWDQEVRQAVMQTQFDHLEISIEKDQVKELLKGALSNNPNFLNEDGIFDEAKLSEYIANLKATSAQAYQQWKDYENSLALNAMQQDYFNMVKSGMTGTLAEGELEHKLEGDKVDIKFVQIPYVSIPDSTVTVSKSEINNYINAHKKQYEVQASRSIRYVEFKEVASVEDENAIKNELAELLKDRVVYNEVAKTNDTIIGFQKVTNYKEYVNANSDQKFDDRFVFKSSLPSVAADSIFNLNVGEVYGPYKDNNQFKITKMAAVTQLPDSVKARHILIPFVGASSAPEDAQVKIDAKKTADSLLAILKNDTSKFGEFVTEFSSDQGSVNNGGSYDYFPYNRMVPAFRDFTFENNTGDLGVVETPYGFHIIEIEGQKNKQRAVKVATIARTIEPSDATIDNVFRDASSFEIAVEKSEFPTVAEEKGYVIRPVSKMKVLDENIPGLGNQRSIVRWAFEEGTDIGDVKRFTTPTGYAIVQLTEINVAGMMNTEDASVTALPIIRKQKKAEIIKNRVSATTLDALASAEGQTVRSSLAINMKNPTISGAGKEGVVVGAAFGLEEGETSGLIEGEKGVYMVQVTKKTPATALDNYQGFANQVSNTKATTVNSKLYNALKDAAEIEDNRAATVQ
ncbi:peptidylprolyl isomerase [Corallibacter sp.]|uniref:peptidylprolyl isomerase n=1 Tax=Corallibacter sp. TaxID=2038084 RepID=UPI003AB1F6F0